MGRQPGQRLRTRQTLHPKKLILAAGDCATDDDCPPPRELIDAWRCNRYRALPESGGMRDQLAGDIERMEAAETVYDAVFSWHRMFYDGIGGSVGKWQRTHRHYWRITQGWMRLKRDDL
jgi:hypothetical protein